MGQGAGRRVEDAKIINRWWDFIRPYWHVASTLVIITIAATANWSKVAAYDDRIISIENWRKESSNTQTQQSQDIAVVKQQVSDIHDYLLPRPPAR